MQSPLLLTVLATLALLGMAAEATPLHKRNEYWYNRLKNGKGKTTFWTENADPWGSCLLDPPADGMAVAIAKAARDNWGWSPAELCGACIRIHHAGRQVVAQVVNELPDGNRGPGDLDVTGKVWRALTDQGPGELFDVYWEIVDCPGVSGPLKYRFKEGSSQYWAGIEVRNHRKVVTGLEVNGKHPQRQPYNHFVSNDGFGPGPLTIKTTFADGTSITDYNIPLRSDGVVDGHTHQ